ncbi:MAG: hypothetical protein ACYTET_07390 [Planctomycetota bacterium]|jgi:hypothetical protein
MTKYNKQFDKRRGAALILVIVVTVLLAVIGVMFLMVSRLSEMETSTVANSRDLESGVEAVVAQINQVLIDTRDDTVDYGTHWLASLEPNYMGTDTGGDDIYEWLNVTDLWNDSFGITVGNWVDSVTGDSVSPETIQAGIVKPTGSVGLTLEDETDSSITLELIDSALADADGDGVADSRWIQIPGLTSTKGKPLYAAVRIIDNCAMLNLNTACNFYAENSLDWFVDDWKYTLTGSQYDPTGRYLSEVNYRPFLRGDDRNIPANNKAIELAKDQTPTLFTPEDFHDLLIMNIENHFSDLTPFDLSSELEIRNRFLLTSLTSSEFEQETVAYNTFDWGSGDFASGWSTALKSKRIPCDSQSDLEKWYRRLDPDYTGSLTMTGDQDDDYYDRRHLCTFYNYARNLRAGDYLLLESEISDYASANYAAAGYDTEDEYFDGNRSLPEKGRSRRISVLAQTPCPITTPKPAAAFCICCMRFVSITMTVPMRRRRR